ncbi:unnamed protein product [Ilex paraguariensis]|uniref:Uncharacterized protein n=1 Tax=Ilex paraguariensis TaxID=185542 RepID=A0ABC8RGU4_9AQUA
MTWTRKLSRVQDQDCYGDIQGVYDQLYVQFIKQQKKVLSLSCWVNSGEEKTRALHSSLEDENKSLPDRMSFLERDYNELVNSKENLESKCGKLDIGLRESNELSNRLLKCNEKFA